MQGKIEIDKISKYQANFYFTFHLKKSIFNILPQRFKFKQKRCEINQYLTYKSMYEEEQQQEVKDPDADLPPFKIRHNDMKMQLVKLIVRKVVALISAQIGKPEQMLQKDICLRLVEYLRANKADFGAGEGEWQCIIGKNLAVTLNYDLHMLTFFDLPQFGYSILVFKSG